MSLDLLIGGENVSAEGGKTYARNNPVSGAVVSEAAAASVADALAAVASAQAAFAEWSATGPEARRSVLMKAADIMDARSGAVGVSRRRDLNGFYPQRMRSANHADCNLATIGNQDTFDTHVMGRAMDLA